MIGKSIQKLRDHPWVAQILTSIGFILYFIQAWVYAHIQTSFLDEGVYLYIGNLFVRGVIRPFQDYGPIGLYAPLAFLIPGKIEAWFGSSLQTGRYFSVFCGLLMVVALWSTARRFGGKWWAAATVWGIALTPISIQIYSLAITEALVACLLVCSLAFLLGEGRSLWQIITGSILAGLAVMTRQNLAPVIPILVAYVFWQHGKKRGWWAIVGCLLPILVIHIIYWPNILELWAIWLPARLTPFLDPFRFPTTDLNVPVTHELSASLLAFFQGIRFHYFTTIGFGVVVLLWPGQNEWKSQVYKRAGYLLATLFLTLALLHAYKTFIATNPASDCTFCFTPYLSFFDVIVFLLISVTFTSWRTKFSKIRRAAVILFILVLSLGLGYAAFDRFGPWLLNFKFPAFNRGLDPHHWVPFISLWDILANKFNQDFWTSRAPVSAIAGLFLGILLLIIGNLFFISFRRRKLIGASFSAFILTTLLAAGVLLSPLMGGTYRDKGICQADVLQAYDQIGNTLNNRIPENSLIYWAGDTAVPLLYAPKINVYYPQIYASVYYRSGGEPDQLLKKGFWNTDLAGQWLSESTFIVAGPNWYQRPDYPSNLDLSKYVQFQTIPANPCDPASYLIIYRRKP
jgi:4-amino-4-deoxy-L-arabinose transferase-like glycosyltransferase